MRYASYMGTPDRRGHTTGEQRLMLAMLEDCLRTLLGRHTAERTKWQQRDLAWITSDDRTDVFAFENVCEAVGIEPCYLRDHVLAALADANAPGLERA